MNPDTALHRLLDRICAGDEDATREIYDEYAPYLKMVVRRRVAANLQARFDSSDVVQSVWADLLDGFRKGKWSFESPDHLRAFLVRATRNRLVDYVRRHGDSTNRQAPLDDEDFATHSVRPSSEARANEHWEAMLQNCSLEHRQILEMKRKGHTIAEIAERTGYHPSSVRRILYSLAEQADN